VSPVRYEQGFYIPKDGILHSDRREHLKSYITFAGYRVQDILHLGLRRRNSNNAVVENRCIDGSEDICLTCRPPFTLRKIPGTHFCWRLGRSQSHSAARRIRRSENLNDLAENRSRELAASSRGTQATARPCANYGCSAVPSGINFTDILVESTASVFRAKNINQTNIE
jgi:hypothetical protein